MTADSHALTTAEHAPVAGLAHDSRGGISNPILGMLLFITSEVMFFAGLFAAYFSTRAANKPWPPDAVQRDPQPVLAHPRGDRHPDRELVHLPVRDLGDPEGRPARVPPQHRA